jgi:putative transposase
MLTNRNRTSSLDIDHALYLYFLGLSTRGVSKAIFYMHRLKRSHHVTIWKWIQKYTPQKISSKRKRISEISIDYTLVKVGPEHIWLWVTIEPENRQILIALTVSKERNMFVAERFLHGLITINGKHPVSTDGRGTWYPMACLFRKLKHHIHSSLEKSLIERTMQYIKDRTESFDDYFPCRMNNCKLKHIRIWLNMFSDYHNKEVVNT